LSFVDISDKLSVEDARVLVEHSLEQEEKI
jgi:hypothetical protein